MATFATAVGDDSQDFEDTDVEVTVAEETAVDLKPSELVYNALEPGSTQSVSDNGIEFSEITLENTGSTRINQMWLETTKPTEKGIGSSFTDGDDGVSGDDLGFDTGNFLRVDNLDSENDLLQGSDNPRYVSRKEYVERTIPPYLDLGGYEEPGDDASSIEGSGDSDNVAFVGRIRNGGDEFFWAITADDGDLSTESEDLCDGSATESNFVIANDAITASDDSIDFTEGSSDVSVETIEEISGQDNIGVVNSVDIDGETYDIFTRCQADNDEVVIEGNDQTEADGSFVQRNRYDMDPEVLQDGIATSEFTSAADFILETTNEGAMFAPGQITTIGVSVEVPTGVAMGQINDGQLTMYATQDPDHNVDGGGGGNLEDTGDLQ